MGRKWIKCDTTKNEIAGEKLAVYYRCKCYFLCRIKYDCASVQHCSDRKLATYPIMHE